MAYEYARNRSGYCDPTASMGLSGYGAKPGEIWESRRNDDEAYLVIKNHGTYSSVLLLRETEQSGPVEVIARQKMYTNPQLVSYSHNGNFGDFLKKVPFDKFSEIVRLIEDALDLSMLPEADKTKELAQIEHLKAKCKELEAKITEQQSPCHLTKSAEIELLWAQAQIARNMYDELIEKIVEKKVE